MAVQPEYEHRVVIRDADGKVRSSSDPCADPGATGDRFRTERKLARGHPEIGSVEIQRRPINIHPWECVEIARNAPGD